MIFYKNQYVYSFIKSNAIYMRLLWLELKERCFENCLSFFFKCFLCTNLIVGSNLQGHLCSRLAWPAVRLPACIASPLLWALLCRNTLPSSPGHPTWAWLKAMCAPRWSFQKTSERVVSSSHSTWSRWENARGVPSPQSCAERTQRHARSPILVGDAHLQHFVSKLNHRAILCTFHLLSPVVSRHQKCHFCLFLSP